MTGKAKVGIMALIAVVAVAAYGARNRFGAAGGGGEVEPVAKRVSAAVPVILGEIASRHFEESLRVQGNLEAMNYAVVSPKLAGTLAEVCVREGDKVAAGVTPLFKTDSVKLAQAVEIARQSLKVASCERREKEAAVEQVEADLKKAQNDLQRSQALFESKVISPEEIESRQADYDRFAAAKKLAESQLDLKREEERRSETSLAMAEENLRDAVVLAPIDGVVSKRMAEAGEMGTPGVPVVRIDDVNTLEVSAFLPGEFYKRIEPGVTSLRVSAGGAVSEHAVTYKSPTVDPTLRTFEIKCGLNGDGRSAVPGALVEVEVVLQECEGLAVPVEAVQERGGSKVIFVERGGLAAQADVETGLETGGYLQVSGEGLAAGTKVVVVGQFMVSDGSTLAVREGGL